MFPKFTAGMWHQDKAIRNPNNTAPLWWSLLLWSDSYLLQLSAWLFRFMINTIFRMWQQQCQHQAEEAGPTSSWLFPMTQIWSHNGDSVQSVSQTSHWLPDAWISLLSMLQCEPIPDIFGQLLEHLLLLCNLVRLRGGGRHTIICHINTNNVEHRVLWTLYCVLAGDLSFRSQCVWTGHRQALVEQARSSAGDSIQHEDS